jgi:hypothetical protein
MADNKLIKLVELLAKRSEQGKVRWDKTLDDGVFQAAFSEGFSLRISERPSADDPEGSDFVVTLYNEEGEVIERFSDLDFGSDQILGQHPYHTLAEIYTTARRTAMGAAKAIDTIIGELREPGDDEPNVGAPNSHVPF